MATLEKVQIVPVKSLPNGSERFIQDLIAEDPSVLTLGNLILREKERTQPSGGRLDILLEDAEGQSWYEVEIQLGPTNETHIIRTIEYWDRERRRYPDIRHTAVIVAEEINGRFFNVISLFNQQIPLVALKVIAFKQGDQFGVLFTKILDYEPRGAEESEAPSLKADRQYWEKRSGTFALKAAEKFIEFATKSIDSTVAARYNKAYIGTTVKGEASNFTVYYPQKNALRLSIKCKQRDDFDKQLEEKVIRWTYDNGPYAGYSLILSEAEIAEHDSLIKKMIVESYRNFQGEPPIPQKGDARNNA